MPPCLMKFHYKTCLNERSIKRRRGGLFLYFTPFYCKLHAPNCASVNLLMNIMSVLQKFFFYILRYGWWCMFERITAAGENYSPFEGGAKAKESK